MKAIVGPGRFTVSDRPVAEDIQALIDVHLAIQDLYLEWADPRHPEDILAEDEAIMAALEPRAWLPGRSVLTSGCSGEGARRDDVADGGNGKDLLDGGAGTDACYGSPNDELVSCESTPTDRAGPPPAAPGTPWMRPPHPTWTGRRSGAERRRAGSVSRVVHGRDPIDCTERSRRTDPGTDPAARDHARTNERRDAGSDGRTHGRTYARADPGADPGTDGRADARADPRANIGSERRIRKPDATPLPDPLVAPSLPS